MNKVINKVINEREEDRWKEDQKMKWTEQQMKVEVKWGWGLVGQRRREGHQSMGGDP